MPTFMPEVPGICYEYFTMKMLYKLSCVNATEAEADNRYPLFWGNIGIMEKKMETTIGIIGYILGLYWNRILWYPIMENQMEKKIENEMETGVI